MRLAMFVVKTSEVVNTGSALSVVEAVSWILLGGCIDAG